MFRKIKLQESCLQSKNNETNSISLMKNTLVNCSNKMVNNIMKYNSLVYNVRDFFYKQNPKKL